MEQLTTGTSLTREERKNSYGYFDKYNKDKLVDEIYDDLERRTCGNCKHYGGTKFSSNMSCQIGVVASYYNNDHNDFGCNKFERMEDV